LAAWVGLAVLATACEVAVIPEDGGTRDAGPQQDGGRDAGPDGGPGTDGGRDGGRDGGPPVDGGGCGGRCPPELCVGGVCVTPGDCCETGECPRGFTCDWRSCGCVELSGCCAGERCAGGEFCDFGSCRCVSETDCCFTGWCEPGLTCDGSSCGCVPDTSCGPSCTGDFVCSFGSCMHRCQFEGCPEGLLCGDLGCVAPQCTSAECIARDPMELCDPANGCYDPCEPAADWEWCRASGGVCRLGQCVDPTCRGGTIGCNFRVDCCGRRICIEDSEFDPPCDPRSCGPVEAPPRNELCACQLASSGGTCVDLSGGFIGPPRPF
jgi:hypothetical protein